MTYTQQQYEEAGNKVQATRAAYDAAVQAHNHALDAIKNPAIVRAWGGWEAVRAKVTALGEERSRAFDAWQKAEAEFRPMWDEAVKACEDLRRKAEEQARFEANAQVAE